MITEKIKAELDKKVEKMSLTEINKRLEEINTLMKNNPNEAIDEVIVLLEETKILKAKGIRMLGDIENYLAEQN